MCWGGGLRGGKGLRGGTASSPGSPGAAPRGRGQTVGRAEGGGAAGSAAERREAGPGGGGGCGGIHLREAPLRPAPLRPARSAPLREGGRREGGRRPRAPRRRREGWDRSRHLPDGSRRRRRRRGELVGAGRVRVTPGDRGAAGRMARAVLAPGCPHRGAKRFTCRRARGRGAEGTPAALGGLREPLSRLGASPPRTELNF